MAITILTDFFISSPLEIWIWEIFPSDVYDTAYSKIRQVIFIPDGIILILREM
jgi:hypothetical protein